MLEEKAMEDAFLDDLQKGRFEVWYQPKYSPEDEKLIGAEGLIRWRLKDGSLMSPAKFIPLFERDGLIRILDEYVFRNVCNKQMEWKWKGLGVIPVSINLSRASLYFESVVKQYHSIASEIGVDTELVPIEITESAAIDNENINRLIEVLANNRLSVKEMMAAVGLKNRENFMEYSLNPAIKEGFVSMLYPDKPRHPRQKYM